MSAAASESEDSASLTLESKGPYARAAMDTLRVDVTYRLLRVGWALLGHDIEACRQAARLNYTLWGGRFNPLIPVDRPDHARQLVDSFRVDVILPIGTTSEVSNFAKSFPWLINPFHGENIFVGGPPWGTKANVLDVHNLLSHAFQKREERELRRAGVRLYSWDEQDPLADPSSCSWVNIRRRRRFRSTIKRFCEMRRAPRRSDSTRMKLSRLES
jgi:hypothetical protein